MSAAKLSDARIRANAKYNAKTYEVISTRARKEEGYNAMLDEGARITGKSKATYILDALKTQLRKDGILRDQESEQ